MLSDLKSAPPEYIVRFDGPGEGLDGSSCDDFEVFESILENEYKPALIKYDFEILKRSVQ